MTSASKFRSASAHSRRQHGERVAADGVHLRVELDGKDAVAQVDQAGPGVPAHRRPRRLRAPEDLQVRCGGWQSALTEADRLGPCRAGAPLSHQRRGIGTRARRLEHRVDANRIPQLERTQLPAEAPPHRAVDIVDRVRNIGCDACRIDQRRRQRRPQELADAVAAQETACGCASPTDSIEAAASIDGRRGACRSRYSIVAGSRVTIAPPSALGRFL